MVLDCDIQTMRVSLLYRKSLPCLIEQITIHTVHPAKVISSISESATLARVFRAIRQRGPSIFDLGAFIQVLVFET